MPQRFLRIALSVGIMIAAFVGVLTVAASPAQADTCYTWSRTLSSGATGSDVTQLQIRIAGWPGYNSTIATDGIFGPATAAALKRFQAAYGLAADGVAGPLTYSKIYALQDSDCTPIHFSYAELNNCNTTWSGGAVAAATAKANALRLMWKLEALRHALGDAPLYISSGFRSTACNNTVDGVPDSRHLYGDAADLTGSPSLCTIALEARYHGFRELLGPGYPGHSTHIHVAGSPNYRFWSASSCGVS